MTSLPLEIFKETPWWVYLLFIFLVLMGLRSIKSRNISVRQLWLFPLAMTALNISWLSERLHGQYHNLFFWFIGIAIGIFFGWILFRNWKIETSKHFKTLILPPTWSSLILILLFFGIRYFFVFNYEVHPEAASHLFLADSLISGFMTGIFIGRSLQLYSKYKYENH